ncbi:glycosyltransferase family 4 protein [bacterium]|nr:glycosyltransferase family 4 protein [bacterium]
MKILLITDLYPVKSDEVTTPRTLYDFVQGWIRLGHSVKIIKPNFILNSFIRKKPFYKTGWYEDVFNVNYWLPFCGDIRKKLKKFYDADFEPDIIIAHMPSGILFADKFGKPFSAGIHCSDITVMTNPKYIFFRERMLKALKNAEKIFCRSHILKRKLTSIFPEFENKTYTAPSGIEERFIINDFTHEIQPDNLKIITCANFKKRKNIDKVIYALKDISDIELTIIGDGERKKELEKISNMPKFIGRLEHEEVLKYMRQNDIFLLPSIDETFGMVYLEAMASGCIPVCTTGEAVDGIIKSGENGFTVKPKKEDIRKLIKQIKNTNKSELAQIRQNALDTVKQYTQKACCENYFKMLSEK